MQYQAYLEVKKIKKPKKVSYTLPSDTVQALKGHREATGIPTSHYLSALIASDLEQKYGDYCA